MKSSPLKIVPGQVYAVLITDIDWVCAIRDNVKDMESCVVTSPELDWDQDRTLGDRIVLHGDYTGRRGSIIKVRRRIKNDERNRQWEEVE
jgi:hypothetical protein